MRRLYILLLIAGFFPGCGDWMFSPDDGETQDHSRVTAGQALSHQTSGIYVEEIEASGNWFTFARMSDGTVYGWGNNFGQLGDATNIRRDVPAKVQACRDAAGTFISASSRAHCESLGGTLGDLTHVKALSTGQNHTLALLDGGTPADVSDDLVVAWGLGSLGQLGDGHAAFSRTAVQVACGEMAGTEFCSTAGTLQGVTAVAAGGGWGGSAGHSLALLSDGSVVAWGWNYYGELANGETPWLWPPEQDPMNTGFEAAPVRVRCGMATGTYCSADGYLTGVTAIEGSAANSFAILSDSTLLAWGNNNTGWLGDGTNTIRPTPVYVSCGELAGTDHCSEALHLQGVAQLAEASTSGFTLVRLSDGTAAAWGGNGNGQLGNGTTANSWSPVRVKGLDGSGFLSDITDVASGAGFNLALLSDGTVASWGGNGAGQLGDRTTTRRLIPGLVIGVSSAVEIAAGYDHSHALLSDGTIIGWGNNNTSQLGIEVAGGVSTPVRVLGPSGPLAGVSAISGDTAHSLALRSDETVFAWGGNGNGQLGNGTTNNSSTAVQVSGMGPWSGVTAIAAGSSFSLALKLDGTVWAWGGNGVGQLGNGTDVNSAIPVQVGGASPISGVAAIATHAWASHSLALESDGTVLAWGSNSLGQLGDGTTVNSSLPTAVRCGDTTPADFCAGGELQGVAAVATGSYHSLALLFDGTVLEWGLGVRSPQPVSDLTGVTALGATSYVSLAVLSDGTVFQWSMGESPLQVPGLADVVAVAGGEGHALALRSDGTVFAWGSNSFGQLGNATTIGSSTPVQVMICRDADDALITTLSNTTCAALGGTLTELTGVTAVAAGYDHSLALWSDGTALAWGSRGNGKLGNGSAGTFFTEPSVLMALGFYDHELRLAPGLALVTGTDWTFRRKIKGDFTNQVVLGPGVSVDHKIQAVGLVVLKGANIHVAELADVENVRVTANGSATIQGDLRFTEGLILEAGATLIVVGDLRCEWDSGASLDPSGTLEVHGQIACPAINTD